MTRLYSTAKNGNAMHHHYDYMKSKYDQKLNACEFGTTAEQECEAHYDTRDNADNDLTKNRIEFPTDKLYGRVKELNKMQTIYNMVCHSKNEHNGKANMGDENSGIKKIEAKGMEEHIASTSPSSLQILFIAGYAGTGKSTLVEEFVKKINKSARNSKGPSNPLFAAGKFEEMKTADPFSAITASISQLVATLLDNKVFDAKELDIIRERFSQVDIACNTDGGKVLTSLVPKIKFLFKDLKGSSTHNGVEDSTDSSSDSNTTAVNDGTAAFHDLNVVQYAFKNLIKAFCTKSSPLIFFIDDLQWADEASLKLISSLLQDKSINHFLFVASYRSNEVDENHSFFKLMTNTKDANKGKNNVHKMELFNLSPDDIGDFIADSINRSRDEVSEIVDVIYSKTLGNIFFVMQALEELARKNALYYDVMFFQWQWSNDLSKADLEKYLSDDVVDMVKSKIQSLPVILQKALVVAAYTRNTIDLDILLSLMQRTYGMSTLDYDSLKQSMDLAKLEGIMLSSTVTSTDTRSPQKSSACAAYRFAHDRIREAACSIVEEGEEKNTLLLGIASFLLEYVDNINDIKHENCDYKKRDSVAADNNDWMLFVAVHHMNLVPAESINSHELALLNYRVANIASSKAAFDQARDLLHVSVEKIASKSKDYWMGDESKYEFILQLYNLLTKTEYTLGDFDAANEYANIVIENANSQRDKCLVYRFLLHSDLVKSGKQYEQIIPKALKILSLYGIKLRETPTKIDMVVGRIQLSRALKMGSIMKIATLPISKENDLMKLLETIGEIAQCGKNQNLADLVSFKMIESMVAQQCITEEIGAIGFYAISLRGKGKLKKAYSYANCVCTVLQRFEKIAMEMGLAVPANCIKVKCILYGCVMPLRVSYRDTMDVFLRLYKSVIACGLIDVGLTAGMVAAFCYFAVSLPLNSLLEPKLYLFEENANDLSRDSFITIFQYQRQFLYNLQGKQNKTLNATSLVGDEFDENKVLGAMEEGSSAKKMTLRDICILRLQLAFIFNDENVMDEMLQILDSYPVNDFVLVRQHLRMTYMGLAAFALLYQRQKNKDCQDKKNIQLYKKWGDSSLEFYRKMVKFGSPNAQPVYLCLKAMKRQKRSAFDKAISCCSNLNLMNLAAMMNERCSYHFDSKLGDDTINEQSHYLATAMWLYQDWGALAKVAQLKDDYDYLKCLQRENPPSKLSFLLKDANKAIRSRR